MGEERCQTEIQIKTEINCAVNFNQSGQMFNMPPIPFLRTLDVVDVRRIGKDELVLGADLDVERRVVAVGIAIVEKAAFLDYQTTRALAGPIALLLPWTF